MSLGTIQLALKHPSVNKVRSVSSLPHDPTLKTWPDGPEYPHVAYHIDCSRHLRMRGVSCEYESQQLERSRDYISGLTHICCLQGWLTVYWQVAVGALGLAMFGVGYMESTGKVIAQKESQQQPQRVQHAQQAQHGQQAQRDEAHLSKTL